MIVEPYRLHPVAPRVAILLDGRRAVSETGEMVDLDAFPADHRLWASYETVYRLVRDGEGEALCWRGEEIRWRHRRFEDGWKHRASDASVIRLPFTDLRAEEQLRGFCLWRDWLASYGASPTGTTGSAAWSLLRARLERRLVTNSGERPPISWTAGGRQALGPAGRGSFRGALAHLDLPAAYASTLAGLRYGGVWLESDPTVKARRLEQYAGGDYPVFVRARVRVPEELYGPLLRRPRKAPRSTIESALLGSYYPTDARIQGVWTWEELRAAAAGGARVEHVFSGWIHRSGWHPFAPWWEAIEEGRSLEGLAGALAKMTGNALWGRFCMDRRSAPPRTIRSRKGQRMRARRLGESGAGQHPAHDLAETVSGRVRAQLYTLMAQAGSQLVLAHTDGAWVSGELHRDGWREKEAARQLDVLDPQSYRFRAPRHGWRHCVAGIPAELAPEWFESKWQEAGYA